MEKPIVLDYFKDLNYIFELRRNVEGYIDSGEELGKKGDLKSDLPILLGKLRELEGKVTDQR